MDSFKVKQLFLPVIQVILELIKLIGLHQNNSHMI